MKQIPITKNFIAIVDDADFELVKRRKWSWAKGGAATRAFHGRGARILMHVLIMNPPKGFVVDHINHDPLDNRRCNLRIATQMQNRWNSRPKNGAKYKGVTRTARGKYAAQIRVNGNLYQLGSFDSERDAASAYDDKARELCGEYAYTNIPNEAERKRRKRIPRRPMNLCRDHFAWAVTDWTATSDAYNVRWDQVIERYHADRQNKP